MVLSSRAFESRQEALRSSMRREGLPALVVFGLSSHAALGTSASGYTRYLTGWTARYQPSMLVLPADGPSTLIVPGPLEALRQAESFPWIERCISESPQRYGNIAREILDDIGAGLVGLVGLSEMPYPVYRDLTAGELSHRPAEGLLDELRVIKDEDEIMTLRGAASISNHMLGRLVESLDGYRGPAWKLMAEMEHAGRSLGAEQAACWLAVGQPATRPRFRLDDLEREIQPEDQVLAGTYVSFGGYWSHCLRMGSVGEPSDQYRQLHAAALQQHETAAAQLRPGNDARRVATEGERVAEELIPGSVQYPARFRYAHFIGLDYAEPPTASCFPQPGNWSQMAGGAASSVDLRPGMVLEIHPNLGGPSGGFGVIGDVYVVRENEAERLTDFPRELFVV